MPSNYIVINSGFSDDVVCFWLHGELPAGSDCAFRVPTDLARAFIKGVLDAGGEVLSLWKDRVPFEAKKFDPRIVMGHRY
jgi:hypothetical protein